MIANYHTHTFRCGHAEGREREYTERALQSGLRILGFADHTPYDYFDSTPRNRPMRMMPEELPEYSASIHSLADEFRGRIEILCGVEAEYYPAYFSRLLELLRRNRVQYMILGQHFLGNEIGEAYCGSATDDRRLLERYVCQCAEAMETGLFSCFAHPDLLYFTGSDDDYEREMRRLCRAAKDTGTPLELNLLGIREKRHYPDPRFWVIAAGEGNDVILGSDAHRPEHVVDPRSEETALRVVGRLGLHLLETLPLRSIE